jgi:hypothetical protein
VFDLLMGNDVAPRKDFIIDSAAALDRSASTPDLSRKALVRSGGREQTSRDWANVLHQ